MSSTSPEINPVPVVRFAFGEGPHCDRRCSVETILREVLGIQVEPGAVDNLPADKVVTRDRKVAYGYCPESPSLGEVCNFRVTRETDGSDRRLEGVGCATYFEWREALQIGRNEDIGEPYV